MTTLYQSDDVDNLRSKSYGLKDGWILEKFYVSVT